MLESFRSKTMFRFIMNPQIFVDSDRRMGICDLRLVSWRWKMHLSLSYWQSNLNGIIFNWTQTESILQKLLPEVSQQCWTTVKVRATMWANWFLFVPKSRLTFLYLAFLKVIQRRSTVLRGAQPRFRLICITLTI